IELDGPEAPIRDGSFREYVDALDDAEPVAQKAPARVLVLDGAVTTSGPDGQSYVALPASRLHIAATIDFDHPAIGRQHGCFDIEEPTFRRDLAPARTFGFMADAEALRARGLARGSSLENSVVLDEQGVMNDSLRFPDEFLRHKVGDMVGDLALLGARLDARIVAERPSHTGNVGLARAVQEHARRRGRQCLVDINKIMEYLPHRYPMLLVDRITH